jgi:conjugative transfer pilus assembly protein TraH
MPLQLYQCMNPNGSVSGGVDNQICTQMQQVNFNYPGIRGWVNSMLFGSADPALAITSTSIIGQVNSGASTAFSASQIQFMQQAGVPLSALLTKTSNPNTRVAIAQRLVPHIVDCVASRVGEALYKGANLIQTSTGYDLNEDQKSHIKQLHGVRQQRRHAQDRHRNQRGHEVHRLQHQVSEETHGDSNPNLLFGERRSHDAERHPQRRRDDL